MTPVNILAIHGILTGLSCPAWPHRLATEIEQCGVHVETEHYRAGPFPRINRYFQAPRLATAFANRIALRVKKHGGLVHSVAHSNGTIIAVKTAERLAAMGIKTDTMVLIGSVLHSDVAKSGLLGLVESGHLRRVVAYCSPNDRAVRHLQRFPGGYGSLGSRGFERKGQRHGSRSFGFATEEETDAGFYVRWFPDFDHSTWFHPDHERKTYDSIVRDMGLIPIPF